MECYNKLVNVFLKENYRKSINDIYEELQTKNTPQQLSIRRTYMSISNIIIDKSKYL